MLRRSEKTGLGTNSLSHQRLPQLRVPFCAPYIQDTLEYQCFTPRHNSPCRAIEKGDNHLLAATFSKVYEDSISSMYYFSYTISTLPTSTFVPVSLKSIRNVSETIAAASKSKVIVADLIPSGSVAARVSVP